MTTTPSRASSNNCVAYVQAVTHFNLMGNAWQWWDAARNVYDRGYDPAPGAVMVFGRTGRMHVGHVAVVREVRSQREIIIDQANWHHGRVDRGVSVIDTSPANDWSSVQVQWAGSTYGGPFPITGFIYAPGTPSLMPAVERRQHETPRFVEAGARTGHAHFMLASLRQPKPKLPAAAAAHHGASPAAHPHSEKSAASKPAQPVASHVAIYRGTTKKAPAHQAKS